MANVDEHHFSIVLRHLVCNAIKFTASGGDIVVRVSRYYDVGLKVDVSDTGDGIKEVKRL